MWINKTKFIKYISSINISWKYKIDDILTSILEEDWLNDFEISSIFDREKIKLINYINNYLDTFILNNLIPPFELLWVDKFLFWTLNAKSSFLNDKQKKRYNLKDILSKVIEKNITPKQFESFCSFILKEVYDFNISNITQYSKDWGIDFFWHYVIKNEPVNFFKELPIYIYWQAKQYSNKIEEKDINWFSAIRKKIIQGMDKRYKNSIPKEYTSDPYLSLPVFITTSSFTRGAIETAKIMNIMLKDLNMIIDDIIIKWNDKIFIDTLTWYEVNSDFLKNI